MAYPTSSRGIRRNIVRNELAKYNRSHKGKYKPHNGRQLSATEREKLHKDTGSTNKKQSIFGAIVKRSTRKTQER